MRARARVLFLSIAFLLGVSAGGPVLAQHHGRGTAPHFSGSHHGGGVRFGVVIGVPGFWPGYYPYAPYYYYPPAVPYSPPVYVQQNPAPAQAAPAPRDWYFCASSETYYPYVKECPEGWQRVPVQTPSR